MRAVVWAYGAAVMLAMMLAASGARATSPEYGKCMNTGDAAEGVTSAMRDCAAAESTRQDHALNALYKQAMSRLDEAGRQRLQRQERAWLKMREITCSLEATQTPDGTAALLQMDDRWLDLNDKRIAELAALAKGAPVRRSDISETAKAASPAYRKCADASGGSIGALKTCGAEESQRQDQRLNDLYRQAMAHYGEDERRDLQRLERVWLKIRDASCNIDMQPDADSARALLQVGNCRLDVTSKRIGDLQEMAEGKDIPPY